MHMPQVTQSIEESLRATGQEIRAYAPFVQRDENVAWRAGGGAARRAQPAPAPPPPPPAVEAAPRAPPARVAAIPGVPRWVQGIVAAVLRDNGQLDREERNDGGGAAVSVETPHQLLQGTIIAAAASYAAYLVALYVLRSAVHVAMLVPTGVYVGLVVVVGAATAAAKR
jgi:hypothetical protein